MKPRQKTSSGRERKKPRRGRITHSPATNAGRREERNELGKATEIQPNRWGAGQRVSRPSFFSLLHDKTSLLGLATEKIGGVSRGVGHDTPPTSSHSGEVFGKDKSKKNPDKSGIF